MLVNLPQHPPAAREPHAGRPRARRPRQARAGNGATAHSRRGAARAGARTTAARTAAAPKRSARLAVAGAAPRPRQGFESESENMNGSVQPPGGAELVASAAEIVGELAKVGLSAGERLLKDVFSRLPRS